MKRLQSGSGLISITLGLGFLFWIGNLFAANKPERLFIPFLDPASQSNVSVNVCSMSATGSSCPPEYTNSASNSNLFTIQEQLWIKEVLAKYKNVTTNSGPPGTILVEFYKTNLIAPPLYWVKTNAYWMAHRTNEILVSQFQYTNSEGREEIRFGAGMSAKFSNKSSDGYNASITRTGGGSLLTFMEIKHDSASGIMARFYDLHAQRTSWDYKLADFNDGHLCEYMQATNGMVFGKWLMWELKNGALTLAAEAKVPYDWNNHRLTLP